MELRLFHYTSLENAQEIRTTGALLPGLQSGAVYLSPDLYDTGEQAAGRLAILDKPVEMVFAVPQRLVPEIVPTVTWNIVRKVRRLGRIVRRGGGAEIALQNSVSIRNAALLCLRSP